VQILVISAGATKQFLQNKRNEELVELYSCKFVIKAKSEHSILELPGHSYNPMN
jgi:hypothetical protein